ncbi:MAG: tRNA (guanosine(46)-N7)-methyltransferase TrmB [Verrucomicrobiota bacterium]
MARAPFRPPAPPFLPFLILQLKFKQMPGTPTPPPASLLLQLPNIVDRLDLSTLFPRLQPVEVELGSGDGSFLVDYAARHPQLNLIGVERFLGRARKIDRKGRRAGLANLRCVRLEASYFLEYLLPQHSVQAIHVYFPDPWPKRRHHKHRLINEHFAHTARQALLPAGMVWLRTDDANYFAQMRAVFAASPFFQETETPPALASLVTDFERDFTQKGIQTLRAAYRAASA